jgi:hypothetical protein
VVPPPEDTHPGQEGVVTSEKPPYLPSESGRGLSALTVPCPKDTCRAPVGEPCRRERGGAGFIAKPHAVRVYVAKSAPARTPSAKDPSQNSRDTP